ncbi:MAG: acetate--CoA ligase family protein [Anaerolineae bacterium]|nr:acetate--CoA ligase family protein [Anaerolineales bacterium]
MPRQNLAPLLGARSVALVGISQPGRFGGRLYANLRDFGYTGQIYGVNPRYHSLYDQPCYPSLSDLPNRPDCAILAVPNGRLLESFQETAALEIPAAVIFASAYLPPSPSPRARGEQEGGINSPAEDSTLNVQRSNVSLQDQLAEIANANGIAVCGPNCMGFFALEERLAVSGYESNPAMPAGSVTLISHSGSMWDALLQNNRRVHFNYAISSGNEMVTSLADYIQFALTDPSTRVIGLFLETVRDPQTFKAALIEAAERDVPIVALKVGRSERGARLAQAHSGALAGADAAYEALFAYYGVRRVKSPDELMDTLELLATGMRASSRTITAICDSGGERGMLVDLAEAEGIEFTPISEATSARLAEILEPGLDPINPLDAWGTGNDYARIFQECLQTLDSDPLTGLNVFAVDLTHASDFSPTYVEVALAAQPHLTHPLTFLVHLAAAAGDSQISRLRQADIPVLLGTETGLRAIRHVLEYSEFQRRRGGEAKRRGGEEARRRGGGAEEISRLTPHASRLTLLTELRQLLQSATGPLDEFASKEILRAYGIATPAEAVATSLAEAIYVAETIGYPLALKTAAGELHKSDRGGVRLNVRDAAALTEFYLEFEDRFGSRVLIQQMIPAGVELLLGLVNDPQFGPMLALGTGGIFVEVLRDHRLLMLPTTPADVRKALLSLRSAALLKGARGHPAADIEAVVDAAMRLAALAADLGDLIAEVDINPLIVLPSGAVAVDALIVPKYSRSRKVFAAKTGSK